MQPVSTTVTFPSEPSLLSLSNVIGVTSQQLPMGPIGYAVNGVAIYNWATSNCCDTGTEELDLIDNCNAHPSPNGQYHYHIYPRCISSCSQGHPSSILGVALDGFPIYGPVHPNGTILTNEYLDECHGIEVDVDGRTGVYTWHFCANIFRARNFTMGKKLDMILKIICRIL